MDDKLIALLQELGTDSIEVVYLYLLLDYGAFLVFLGLCTWAARAFWKEFKKTL